MDYTKDLFLDIFEYHHHFNQKVMDQLIEHQSRLPERAVPLFSHIINAHQIWNARILGLPTMGVRDVHPLDNCKVLDQTNYANTLRVLGEFPLNLTMQYKTTKGDAYENTIRDIMFHIVNHTTHHRGQIISDLRLSGVEPVVSDFIFYRR